MSEHCPGCWTQEEVATHPGTEPCPGVECAACAEKDAEIARCYALLYGARCIYCDFVVSPDVNNQEIGDQLLRDHIAQCEKHPLTQANAEIARLQRIIDGHDLITMRYQKAMEEIARLRAIVAVGQLIVDANEVWPGKTVQTEEWRRLVRKWRSLEGKR